MALMKERKRNRLKAIPVIAILVLVLIVAFSLAALSQTAEAEPAAKPEEKKPEEKKADAEKKDEKKEEKKKTPVIKEMVVKGTPPVSPSAERDTTASSTVVVKEQFMERPETLPEVLAETAGVHVTVEQGNANRSEISIRGSTGEQVKVFLDGVELNSAMGGAVDLSQIPIDMIERIEIYRGSSPLALGSGGIGGVVDIRTKGPSKKIVNFFSGEAGSYNTYSANYTTSVPVGPGTMLICLYRRQSEGNFEFKEDKIPPYSPVHHDWVTRENNDYEEEDALVKYQYKFPSGYRVQVSGEAFQRDQGVPGPGINQARHARLDTQRRVVQGEVSKAGIYTANTDARVHFFFGQTQSEFKDKNGEIGLGPQNTHDVADTYGIDANINYYGLRYNYITVALGTKWEAFHPSSNLNHSVAEQSFSRESLSLALTDEITLLDDKLTISPQIRYDTHADMTTGHPVSTERGLGNNENYFTAYSYKIGALYRFPANISVRANVGRYYRPPNLMELFGNQATIVGNPDLNPETGMNTDAGVIYQPGRLGRIDQVRLEYNYFDNRSQDLIQFAPNSQYTMRAINVADARISGHEFIGSINYRDLVAASVNYTHQLPLNLSENPALNGNLLPGRPRDEAHLHLELYRNFGKLYYDLDYLSGNFLDEYNYFLVEDRVIHSAGLIYRRGKWSVGLEVRNIGNNQVSDVIGYPLPGRSYYFRVEGAL